MSLEITWPRPQPSKSLGNTVVASGVADESVVRVIGECRSTSAPASHIECTVVSFLLVGGGEKERPHYRWSIVFKAPGPGEYLFTVTGLKADERSEPEKASVSFNVVESSVQFRGALGLANIMYPTSNEDITLEANNFTAFGDLIDYPLGLLEFKDSSGQVITPTDLTADCDILQYWSADYPPLAPGLYSLHVEDINGNGETATGIYVGP